MKIFFVQLNVINIWIYPKNKNKNKKKKNTQSWKNQLLLFGAFYGKLKASL